MLANVPHPLAHLGTLGADVHKPATFLYQLLDFITDQLPQWRDRPERPKETSETILTFQLCTHLNSVARHAPGWDILQFKVEGPDEQHKDRKIDLMPSPCGASICIEGRRHVDFDSLMPIECKRLPTPKGAKRDEREYVINKHTSTGGIQRFKAGHHGAAHSLAGMIAYVQDQTTAFWDKAITEWITALANNAQSGWSLQDLLHCERTDVTLRLAVFRSLHKRLNGLSEIELRHLWIEMN